MTYAWVHTWSWRSSKTWRNPASCNYHRGTAQCYKTRFPLQYQSAPCLLCFLCVCLLLLATVFWRSWCFRLWLPGGVRFGLIRLRRWSNRNIFIVRDCVFCYFVIVFCRQVDFRLFDSEGTRLLFSCHWKRPSAAGYSCDRPNSQWVFYFDRRQNF